MAKPGMNSRPLQQFVREVNRNGREMNGVFDSWGTAYLAQLSRDFNKNKSGGGSWPAVKEATKKAQFKRKKARKGFKGKRSKAILVDDGFLRGALTPGGRGQEFRLIANGIRVGFAQTIHSPKSGITMNELAQIHDQGKGDMPKRQLLNTPSTRTLKRFASLLRRGLLALGIKAERLL